MYPPVDVIYGATMEEADVEEKRNFVDQGL